MHVEPLERKLEISDEDLRRWNLLSGDNKNTLVEKFDVKAHPVNTPMLNFALYDVGKGLMLASGANGQKEKDYSLASGMFDHWKDYPCESMFGEYKKFMEYYKTHSKEESEMILKEYLK